MIKLHIRKGDEVIVLSGNERGARGKILSIDREKMRAIVERVALRKRHVRRTQENPKGGVVEKEGSIHISNLMVICPKCGKPARLGRRVENDRVMRACKKCGESIVS